MDALITFGVGAISCLVIGVCAILATMSAKVSPAEEGRATTFKDRMKWIGFFLLYACTFIISVPVGLVVIIVRSVKNKNGSTSKTVEYDEENIGGNDDQ